MKVACIVYKSEHIPYEKDEFERIIETIGAYC
jgi:hypothetical protein